MTPFPEGNDRIGLRVTGGLNVSSEGGRSVGKPTSGGLRIG